MKNIDFIKNIDSKFYDKDYYLKLTSLSLRRAYGIDKQYEILCKIFKNIDDVFNQVVNVNNILNQTEDSYAQMITDNNYHISNELDAIGSIYGVRRNITLNCNSSLDYDDPDTWPINTTDFDSIKNITLEDKVFLIYIKCNIIKNNFTGTREELAKLYNTYEGNNLDLIKLKFMYMPVVNNSYEITVPAVNIYWVNYNEAYQDLTNEEKCQLRLLFLNGLLSIESMGIQYTRLCNNISNISTFYNSSSTTNYVFYTTEPETNQKVGVFA